ncbi:alcohol dehydrogenase catalytic domain-containing protein [Hamadaea tsunoensis]|uniref:alcohol dehydrogenase catalytic domain-containing protein n=1 Tax=Hamadaea tsunoensis TaxID=53368 RepID=UPI0004212E50|nr:Zn-dependent alcohol dehydrogenase [Hamadaea tsunoensis]
MKAVVWHGERDVRVETVPDPKIEEPTDAVIRVTSSGVCGSDLHLYEVLTPFMTEGDILGHEPMGIVEEVGDQVTHIVPGDRVVVPFNIACGHCWMCAEGLYSQCETTQVREFDEGAALFGYTRLYGRIPGAQAEYLRVPQAQFGPVKVPEGPPDDRFVYLSDVLPTAWQAVEYAALPPGGTLLVLGLGPIGDMCCRIALHRGASRVIGVDRIPDRLRRAGERGVETLDLTEHDNIVDVIQSLTHGRGADSVIDAVGMEAHGSTSARLAQQAVGLPDDADTRTTVQTPGVDRLAALDLAIHAVRRGGTVSLAGVYGGMLDPLPMMVLFDKQIQLRMGQANVHRWVDEILPLLTGEGGAMDEVDPLGVDQFATHRVRLADAPKAYENFQSKAEGTVKVLLRP